MRSRSAYVNCFTLLAIAFVVGCGSNSYNSTSNSGGTTTTSPALVPVTLSMQDSFPTGVSPVSFEINVSSATLNPGNVALLTKNADIELTHLQSEPALIGSLNVPAGSYTGLSVVFNSTAQVALI